MGKRRNTKEFLTAFAFTWILDEIGNALKATAKRKIALTNSLKNKSKLYFRWLKHALKWEGNKSKPLKRTLADVLFPLDVNELPVKQTKRCTITPWCEQPNMINDSRVKGKVCWTVGCKQMLSEWVRNEKSLCHIIKDSLWEKKQSHEY